MRRAGVVLLGVCVIAVLVAWLGRGAEPPPAPVSPPAMPGPRLTEPAPPEPKLEAPTAETRMELAREADSAPIIDEILVEKSEVCEGEENLITVRAHTPDGTDPFLHYLVGGKTGQQVPVRSWLSDEGEPPPLEVTVFGRDNVATTAKVPPFVVKRCKLPRSALVTARLRANTWSEFDFEVKLVEAPQADGGTGSTFRPRSFEWSFGDGKTAVTTVPYVSHSFEDRRQDTMFSHLLIEVKVRGNADEPVVGRTTLQLMNPAFENLAHKGVVTLMVQLTPRFPELGADGVVRQKVRLFHHRDRPVFIHNAVLYPHRMDTNEPSIPKPVEPSSVLGTSTIPPGRGIEFEVKLDTRQSPDVFSMEYSLQGKDSEGLPVHGAFSVMRPPQRPTRESSTPVMDPLLKAKIIAARKILNQQFVTDEDLWRLEREGKFVDLEAQLKSGTSEQRPAVSRRDAPEVEPGPPPPGPRATPGSEEERSGDAAPKPRPR